MKHAAFAVLAAGLFASPAMALDAQYSKDVAVPAAQAWAAIGDFCDISAWHPAVEKCELSQKDGATLRTLSLKGGGSILEKLVEQNDETMTLTYVIVEGALPVTNYKSTLKVVQSGENARFDWSGTFDARGVSDANAAKTINGVYAAGVDSLVDKSSR